MKNFQVNLLFFLSLALCGLCAWQWYIQTLLHRDGERLQEIIFEQAGEIQGYTNSMKNMDAEIAGLSARVNELKQAAMTNEQISLQQKQEISRLQGSNDVLGSQIVQYKDIVEKLEAKLKEASEGIAKQNESIKLLISERDDAIKKFNDSMKERNALVEKYNDLVERIKKLQAGASSDAPKQ
jgi:predicted RNase H-like nuclease (RuvC/YqgF family)